MNHRLLLRLTPALLAGVLGFTACTDVASNAGGGLDPASRTDVTNLTADEIRLTSGLQTVDSCDALLERIKDEAVERVGPYGFEGHVGFGGPMFAEPELAENDDAMADEAQERFSPAADSSGQLATEGGAGSGDGDFSETNNQEQGVDEADLVKTDGERLVVVSGDTLRVIDVAGSAPRLTRTIQLPGDTWGGQLFLDGDKALLMTTGWTEQPFVGRGASTDWYVGSNIGRLIEIDLEAGEIGRTFEFEGGYLSAREIDGSIRIVLTASADRFSFVYPSNEGATESAEKANRDLIENSTIDQWIPTYRITDGDDTVSEGPIVGCDRVHLPAEFAGFGSVVVLTTDLSDGLAITDALSVFTDAQTVYASTNRVAIATPRWPEIDADGELKDQQDAAYSTALHTFDITDQDRADYVASGRVRGHLLNQYSLSEYDGYLRVATTEGSPWWGGDEQSESFVTVLAENGDVLEEVGQVGGLGRGEQIFAVRFLGEVGYVVTFEQIDPLYVLDLSSPENPEVLGELKIPGFSSYLHPIDESHLLGVGTDGDENGFTAGAVMSLFDVSDLSDPQRVAKLNFDHLLELGEGNSYTPVSQDAKAFNYWDDVAIVPVSWWNYNPQNGSEQSGAEVVLVEVDVAGELTEIGRVSHPTTQECDSGIYIEEREPQPVEQEESDDPVDAEASFAQDSAAEDSAAETSDDETSAPSPGPDPEPGEFCFSWSPEIARSVVIDGDLYTISEAGVGVNDFESLQDIAWISFQR